MPQVRPTEKIHAAAFHFAQTSRDAHEIAEVMGVSVWTLRKWAASPEWQNALNAFGYNGDRSFTKRPTRDTARENGQDFENVKACYLRLLCEGVPPHKLPADVERETGVSKRSVARWAARFEWKKVDIG